MKYIEDNEWGGVANCLRAHEKVILFRNSGNTWWRHQMETSAPWINGWVNNREAGDLRRHRAHDDIIVMNTKIILDWAHKHFVATVHTSFYFLHDMMSPQITIDNTIFTHQHDASLDLFTFWWWHLNWLGNCDAHTWKGIFNSLDIDFIHGDIHDRSFKKFIYHIFMFFNISISLIHEASLKGNAKAHIFLMNKTTLVIHYLYNFAILHKFSGLLYLISHKNDTKFFKFCV